MELLSSSSNNLIKPISKPDSVNTLNINEKAMEHSFHIEDKRLEIEEHETDKTMRSCCFRCHKDGAYFVGKITTSILGIALCSYQLINNNECAYQLSYSSLLGLILGTWLRL